MQNAEQGAALDLDGSTLSIAIVQARFNADITDRLAAACLAELTAMGLPTDQIRLVKVPGALEVPIALQALAESDNYDALIALGCKIGRAHV